MTRIKREGREQKILADQAKQERKNEYKAKHAVEIKHRSETKKMVKRVMSTEIHANLNRYNK